MWPAAAFSYFLNFDLLQKAGFLYVEESFSKSDRVFRRRVVLAVRRDMHVTGSA